MVHFKAAQPCTHVLAAHAFAVWISVVYSVRWVMTEPRRFSSQPTLKHGVYCNNVYGNPHHVKVMLTEIEICCLVHIAHQV